METEKPDFYISKSSILRGLDCPFSLWFEIHNPNLWKSSLEHNTNHYNLQYNQVFKLFKRLLLNDFNQETSENQKTVLFKLKLNFQNLSTEIDALKPIEDGWELYLLKPVANLKKNHIKEAAFNLYILENLGWKIKSIKLITINPKFIYEKEIVVKNYFVVHDITLKTLDSLDSLRKDLAKLLECIKQNSSEANSLPKCNSIKDCKNIKLCYGIDSPQILELRELGDLLNKFINNQIFSFEQIPLETELSRVQKIQVESTLKNTEYIDSFEIRTFLKKLSYPIYFLDFETINPILPLYEKSKPFEHIPFLFYLFILDSPTSELKELYYIENFQSDPREGILEVLSETITKEGTILCFNDIIEKGCLQSAVQIYPKYLHWFESIQNRFLDISLVFKQLHYYHPKQKGKTSLKAVLEPMTNINYEDLEIREGGVANFEFLKLKVSSNISEFEKKQVLQKILAYCKRDAFALVKILDRLMKV